MIQLPQRIDKRRLASITLRYTSFAFLMTFTDSYRFLDADYRSDNQISVSHKVFEKFAIDSVMGLCYLVA